jgi:hypothetical protein
MSYDNEAGACAIKSWILGFLRRIWFHWSAREVYAVRPMSPDLIDIKGYVDEYQLRS